MKLAPVPFDIEMFKTKNNTLFCKGGKKCKHSLPDNAKKNGKMGFWRERQRKCPFLIASILFSARFLMVMLLLLPPVISQLVFLLHILSFIIQKKASDAFTFLFLPSPPLGTKACHKRDCKFIG